MKESKIVELIGQINQKMESAKLEKVKLENSRDIFQTRANELAKELMEKTQSSSVKEAYTKLYNAHEAEMELSKVMSDIADCYDTGDFSDFSELSEKAMSLSEKIKNIIPMENSNISVKAEEKVEAGTEKEKNEELEDRDIEEDKIPEKEEPKKEIKEEPKKHIEDDDDEDDEVVVPKSKTSSTKSRAKKTVEVDDDDEDI